MQKDTHRTIFMSIFASDYTDPTWLFLIMTYCQNWFSPMRPEARGLVQHGGPPGWPEESDPAGVILYVMDGPYRLPFPYCTGCPDKSCPVPSCELIFSWCYIINVHNHPSWATPRKESMAWYSSRPIHAFSLVLTIRPAGPSFVYLGPHAYILGYKTTLFWHFSIMYK